MAVRCNVECTGRNGRVDALEYLTKIVEPTISELEKDPADLRKAFLACMATKHTVDHIAHEYNRDISDISKQVLSAAPHFRWISDVANLAKHAEFDAKRYKKRTTFTTFAAIHNGPSAAFSDGTYFSDGTSWTDATKTVRVRYSDNSGIQLVDVTAAVRSVATALRKYLESPSMQAP